MLLIIFVSLLWGVQARVPTQLVGGLFLEKLARVQFYQHSVPLIFKIDTPNCGSSQHQYKEKCVNSTMDCHNANPWVHLTETARNKSWIKEQILADDGRIGYQSPIRNHVRRLISTDEEVEELQKRIEAYGYVVHELTAEEIFVNQVKRVEKLEVINYIEIREQSRTILAMCQTRKLAVDFMGSSELQGKLDILKDIVKTTNLTLSLPNPDLYYVYPLVECNLGKTHSLIAIHIPLIEILPAPPVLIKLISPYFAWKTSICSLNMEGTQVALVEVANSIKYFLPHCDSLKDDLCFISASYEINHPNMKCLRTILTGGKAKEVAKQCPLTCKETSKLPIVYSISPTAFLITNAPSKSNILCGNQSTSVENINNYGILKIDLPCRCSIHLSPDTILKPQFPCLEKYAKSAPEITRLIPAEWSKLESIEIPPVMKTPPSFSNLFECLNENWSAKMTSSEAVPWTKILERVVITISLLLSIVAIGLWTNLIYHQYKLVQPLVLSPQPARIPNLPSLPHVPRLHVEPQRSRSINLPMAETTPAEEIYEEPRTMETTFNRTSHTRTVPRNRAVYNRGYVEPRQPLL